MSVKHNLSFLCCYTQLGDMFRLVLNHHQAPLSSKLRYMSLLLRRGFITRLNLPEGLGMIEAGIKVFEDTGWNEQQAVTKQGTVRNLACLLWTESEEIRRERKRRAPCLVRLQCFISGHLQGPLHRHLDCWAHHVMTQVTPLY